MLYICKCVLETQRIYLQSVAPGVVPSPLCLLVVVDEKAGVEDEETVPESLDRLPLFVQESLLDGFGHIKAKRTGWTTAASFGAARHCSLHSARVQY